MPFSTVPDAMGSGTVSDKSCGIFASISGKDEAQDHSAAVGTEVTGKARQSLGN